MRRVVTAPRGHFHHWARVRGAVGLFHCTQSHCGAVAYCPRCCAEAGRGRPDGVNTSHLCSKHA